ncbi:integral membrane protein [Arcticibacter tournemirensis]|uniref:DUF3817 domain-containing protein n=2 Tax=Arcticibacter tournemirensis TaxID=699437 RepID=A0A4Q0M8Y7_9SPHI|nr:DUF3817 domain-containing protein [Arcticibacter tournemirensis]RXF69650.1 DUF3817 domain-containing protein [Arcticibacter tournemirensis]TQM49997.1 integral membrane protein [Arcticibacter tournemirensis]
MPDSPSAQNTHTMNNNYIAKLIQLRRTGFCEAVSFVVLLCVAMPLKYYYDYPLAVKYTGWAHGLLFIIYIAAVLRAAYAGSWGLKRIAIFLTAAFVPLAPFFLEKSLKTETEELRNSATAKLTSS